ncbi:hypothetical protein [Qipengyuania sp. ASV99]|uniref:hypothetical protein n=1 Tax=Qipengyuania sp. ASV99 TaxID=3399681 RepID=UPI003A4C805D
MRKMRDVAARPVQHEPALMQRWADLHTNAAKLASVAGLKPEPLDEELAVFPALLGEAGEWQRAMAKQGIEDMDAMMRPGLAALDRMAARGLDASVPALALWREFFLAREAVLALIPDDAEPAAAA